MTKWPSFVPLEYNQNHIMDYASKAILGLYNTYDKAWEVCDLICNIMSMGASPQKVCYQFLQSSLSAMESVYLPHPFKKETFVCLFVCCSKILYVQESKEALPLHWSALRINRKGQNVM